MPDSKRRPPISTRHAFALAFDLAVRRDPVQSLVIPFLLRAPWALTLALLPSPRTSADPSRVLLAASVALVGDFITMLVISAMLRLRARSVFNTPGGVHPAPAAECYARGLRRIPPLLLTEVVRNTMLWLAASCSILPAAAVRLDVETFFEDLSTNVLLLVVAISLSIPTLFLGFRLGVATESVVLDEHHMASAFQRSFRMMRGRFERWFELISSSAALVLGMALLTTLVGTIVPAMSDVGQIAMLWILLIAVTPVFQYAWTFFYLRLVEIDEPLQEVWPAYASAGEAAGELPAEVGPSPAVGVSGLARGGEVSEPQPESNGAARV